MSSPRHSSPSLYEKLGGMPTVEAAVEIFYLKVMEDDSISHFFRWTHMMQQLAKQKAFLAHVFGGPSVYNGKSLNEAHAHLRDYGLTDAHFDRVIKHLVETLQELGIDPTLVKEVQEVAENTRKDVMGRE